MPPSWIKQHFIFSNKQYLEITLFRLDIPVDPLKGTFVLDHEILISKLTGYLYNVSASLPHCANYIKHSRGT